MMRPQQLDHWVHKLTAQPNRLNFNRQALVLIQLQPKAIDILRRQRAIDSLVEFDLLRFFKTIVGFNLCDARKWTDEHAAKIRNTAVVANLCNVFTKPTVVIHRDDHLDRFMVDDFKRFCRDAFVVCLLYTSDAADE